MHRRVGLSFAILLGLASIAQAAGATIVVGNHTLAPNQNGGAQNTIQILITGGNDTNISGAGVNVQVADGGPLAGGAIVGPGVTGNMTLVGSLFATNNTGINDTNPGQVFGNQLVLLGTTTSSGTVSDVGGALLVTLTFDTTGFTSGSWPLNLTNTLNGDTAIGATTGLLPLAITNGNISIQVPEPSSVILGLFAAAGLAAVAVRKNRARRAA